MAYNDQQIIPVKVALTEGDFYTLWAPSWKQHGEEWQAFLGKGNDIYFFTSPAELLAYLATDDSHDLTTHPKWADWSNRDATRVVPAEKKGFYDVIGVPALLAEHPTVDPVDGVSRAFKLVKSLGEVSATTSIGSFFSKFSVLYNVHRGSDHYATETGLGEWSAVGRAVLTNWKDVVEALDKLVVTPTVDEAAVTAAEEQITAAAAAAEKLRLEQEKEAAEAAEKVDPYDASIWGSAGIDPIKIAIGGRILYTLRSYVNGQPVFLGRYGQIHTFNSSKALARWLVEHHDHDMTPLSTWPDIMDLANNGTLEVLVHDDNVYSFNGLADAIAQEPKLVDTKQMRQAYELLADAADWAHDDGVNAILVANPELQDYMSYMLGGTSGYLPSPPYTKEADGWKQLEDNLTKRFSRF